MSVRSFVSVVLIVCVVGCAARPTQQPGDAEDKVVADVSVEMSDEVAQDSDFEWNFADIAGQKHEPFVNEATRGVVVVFITTDCPIANYYQPTLSRLTDEYEGQGIPFFLCHSDRNATLEEVAKHAEEFKPTARVILDSDQTIASHLGAKVTPEAFLIDREGTICYRGRINDLYADYGKRRATPRTNDLRDAIEAYLAGDKILAPKTRAVGCYISYPKEQAE